MKNSIKEIFLETLHKYRIEIWYFGIKKLTLFGSFARDKQKEISGIDFLNEFKNNPIKIGAITKSLDIIGGASNQLQTEVKEKCDNVPWQLIIYFRIKKKFNINFLCTKNLRNSLSVLTFINVIQ